MNKKNTQNDEKPNNRIEYLHEISMKQKYS